MGSTCMAMVLGVGVARTDAGGANWPFFDHITRPEPSTDHAQVGPFCVIDHAEMEENRRSRSRRGTDHASKTDVWTGSKSYYSSLTVACLCPRTPVASEATRKPLVASRSHSCFSRSLEALLKVRACSEQAARLASIYRTSHMCRSRRSHMIAATRRRQRWQQKEKAMPFHPHGGDDFGAFCVGQRRE